MGLFKDPYDWAYEAHDKFVSALSEEFRDHFAHGSRRGEARVVVYGESQVGKTSLILDLMGISPGQFSRVSRVLRGERTSGQSATASAMQYRRSPDDQWRVFRSGAGDLAALDDADAAKALASLRREMEEDLLDPGEVSVVAIPTDCFEGDGVLPVAMLDLPGANAAGEQERLHVHEVASRYVATADIVLLVGKGDWLSFLKPERLNVPGIEDWQLMSWRFRIVFTHAYTLDSIKTALMQHAGPLKGEALRKIFVEQVATFKHLDDDIGSLVYPLEFGDSWLALDDGEGSLKERLAPLNEALKEELKSDIAMACADAARLRSALNAHQAAERIGRRRIEEVEGALIRVDAKRARAQTKLAGMKAAWKAAEQQLEDLKAGGFGFAAKKSLLNKLTIGPPLGEGLDLEEISLEDLEEWRSTLTRAALDWRPDSVAQDEYRKFWRPSLKLSDLGASVDSLMEAHFDDLCEAARPGIIRRIFTRGGTRQAKLRAKRSELQSVVSDLVREKWRRECVKRLDRRAVEIERAVQAVEGARRTVELRQSELRKLSSERRTLITKLEDVRKRVMKDRQVSQRFHRFLAREYQKSFRSSLRACGARNSSLAAFAELIYLVRMGRARRAIGAEW